MERLSAAEIAVIAETGKSTVLKYLKLFQIPIREAHKPHGRPSQPRYGQKLIHGEAQVHKTEQRVIETIKSLKSQGLGLREIARTLTGLGIATKSQGRAWHPEMIRRVLANNNQ